MATTAYCSRVTMSRDLTIKRAIGVLHHIWLYANKDNFFYETIKATCGKNRTFVAVAFRCAIENRMIKKCCAINEWTYKKLITMKNLEKYQRAITMSRLMFIYIAHQTFEEWKITRVYRNIIFFDLQRRKYFYFLKT